ncbi:MAG: hypothetical protein DI598_15805 [Pseudopedobacter saltans]|uniref:Lipoprotein n=1 Tax=Pseudopedobacter saltans TaxID=151895 RepID=A0A2W5EN92_9SPHI|nr:MAG: hypothetical protein DI598_15805 [Pseudopedobacter saltans]
MKTRTKHVCALLTIVLIVVVASCQQTDFTNPESVVKEFRTLTLLGKNEDCYDRFLSSKSKGLVTKDEFVKTREGDSSLKKTIVLSSKITVLPTDVTK